MCLSPHGESGLKSDKAYCRHRNGQSLPTRGEWVEIRVYIIILSHLCMSLPTRGEWVEIVILCYLVIYCIVSPHTGRVG